MLKKSKFIIPEGWRGSSHDHKGSYTYNYPSRTTCNRFQSRAFYNPDTKVLEMHLFPTANAQIDNDATQSQIKRELRELFSPKCYICIVEDGHKVRNKEEYIYGVQWYCRSADFPEKRLLDQAMSIASNYTLLED